MGHLALEDSFRRTLRGGEKSHHVLATGRGFGIEGLERALGFLALHASVYISSLGLLMYFKGCP